MRPCPSPRELAELLSGKLDMLLRAAGGSHPGLHVDRLALAGAGKTQTPVVLLKRKISGLASGLVAPAMFRVDVKATMLPLSLSVALRLSSATKGGSVVVPAAGVRLAGVFVTCVNVPALRST